MVGRQQQVAFVLNANVVIDYADADASVLTLVTRHLGVAYLASPLLAEVDRWDEEDCARLGVTLVEPTFAQLIEASSRTPALSFEDRLCLVLARDLDATCVTNDKRLRMACEQANVRLLWGLELMHKLVAKGALTQRAAIRVASTISANNPLHVTDKIIEAFERRLRGSR